MSTGKDNSTDRADGWQVQPEPGIKGFFPFSHQLRADLKSLDKADECVKEFMYFLTDITAGWRTHWALLSQRDVIYGPMKSNGERMTELAADIASFTTAGKAMKRAVKLGFAEEKQYPGWGTAYAVARKYWRLILAVAPNLFPEYELRFCPYPLRYDPNRDKDRAFADETQPATASVASNAAESTQLRNGYITENAARYSQCSASSLQPLERADATAIGAIGDAPRQSTTSASGTLPLDTSKPDTSKLDGHSAFAPKVAKAGAPNVAPLSSLKNVSVNGKKETSTINATKEEIAPTAEPEKQTIRHAKPAPSLETGASEVAANARQEALKQSAEQINQGAGNISTLSVPAVRSTYDKQQWAEMIRRQAATLAAKPAGTPQNEPESTAPLSGEAQAILQEAARRPDNITDLHSPKKKGREGKIASYREYIKTQRENVADLQEQVREGRYWQESRLAEAQQALANYEKAVKALEHGLSVDLAQEIALGRMAMLPPEQLAQVQMYIS